MNAYQILEVTRQGSAVIACVKEEYLSTGIAAEMLQTELQHVLMELSPRILVIDFRVVRMLSSSPIGVLLKIQQRMRDVEGELRLANVAVPIEEVYRTLGLADSHLPVYDSVQQALAIQSIDGSEEEREMMED